MKLENRICECGCETVFTPKVRRQRFCDKSHHSRYINSRRKTITYDDVIDEKIGPLLKQKFESMLYTWPEILTLNASLQDQYCITFKKKSKKVFNKPNQYLKFSYVNWKQGIRLDARGHVISAMIHFGDPKGMSVLHSCDIPFCCNPNHLYYGDQTSNIYDVLERSFTHPEISNRYVVESIRYYSRLNTYTTKELAKHFNLHETTIRNIVSYRRYNYRTDGTEVLPKNFVPIYIPKPSC